MALPLRKRTPMLDTYADVAPQPLATLHQALPMPALTAMQPGVTPQPLINGTLQGNTNSDPFGIPAVNMQQDYGVQSMPGFEATELTQKAREAALDAINNAKSTIGGRFMQDFSRGQQLFASIIGPLVGLSSPFGGAAGANEAVKNIETFAKQRADAQLEMQQGAATVMNSVANMINIADPTANANLRALVNQQSQTLRANAKLGFQRDAQEFFQQMKQNELQIKNLQLIINEEEQALKEKRYTEVDVPLAQARIQNYKDRLKLAQEELRMTGSTAGAKLALLRSKFGLDEQEFHESVRQADLDADIKIAKFNAEQANRAGEVTSQGLYKRPQIDPQGQIINKPAVPVLIKRSGLPRSESAKPSDSLSALAANGDEAGFYTLAKNQGMSFEAAQKKYKSLSR